MLAWLAAVAWAGSVEIVNVGTAYTTVYALRAGDAVVLVDTHLPGKEDAILRRMQRAGLDPEQVTAIVLTHGHPDHAGSAAALADRLDVPVIASALDDPYLEAGTAPLHPTGARGRLAGAITAKRFPPVAIDVPVGDRLDLGAYGVPGEVRVVGGHTPGSVVVALPGGEVFVGDQIRSRLLRHHAPTLHLFHDDPRGAHEVLRSLLEQGATTVYPCHGGALDGERLGDWLDRRGVHHDERLAADRGP